MRTVRTGPRSLDVGVSLVAGLITLLLMQEMEHRLGEIGEVYHHGAAGKFSWAAKALAGAGAAILATRGHRSRSAAVVGGTLVCAGEICLRWAVYKAGFQSARDPKYTVKPQRERVLHGASGVNLLEN